jgi:hypothetical protein
MSGLLALLDVTIEGGPLTQEQALQALKRGFDAQADRSDLLVGLLVAMALLGIIAMLVRWRRSSHQSGHRIEVNYLREVLTRVELTDAQRRLIVQLAQRAKLRHPATMLLSPANFGHALELAGLTPPGDERYREAAAICRKLFDADPVHVASS